MEEEMEREKKKREKLYSMETERNRNSSVKAGRLVGPVENLDYSFQQLSSNTDTRVLIGSWQQSAVRQNSRTGD